jgi:hypothetical protein
MKERRSVEGLVYRMVLHTVLSTYILSMDKSHQDWDITVNEMSTSVQTLYAASYVYHLGSFLFDDSMNFKRVDKWIVFTTSFWCYLYYSKVALVSTFILWNWFVKYRKPDIGMSIHHYVTLVLLSVSNHLDYTAYGATVLMINEMTEPFIYFLRIVRKLKKVYHFSCGHIFFSLFEIALGIVVLIIWCKFRIFMLSEVIRSSFTVFDSFGERVCVILLCVLLLINLFYFGMISYKVNQEIRKLLIKN